MLLSLYRRFLPSSTARFARLANCNVENVSEDELVEGDTHTINVILPAPDSESLSALVNLEFLNGMCVRFLSIKAETQ